MTRRTALALCAGSVAARGDITYRPYSRVLPDYLTRLAAEAKSVRDAALSKLTSPEAVQQRQTWVRQTFWQLVGGRPEISPLNVRTVGSFDRDKYRVEKLVYESQPGLHIPANLYIPKNHQPPFPVCCSKWGMR